MLNTFIVRAPAGARTKGGDSSRITSNNIIIRARRELSFWLIIVVIDLVWTGSALVYDWPALGHIPFYAWPFIIICPVYPFLLALVWRQYYRRRKPNQFLLAFAALPSATYFVAALIYYPTWMAANGFDWLAFGQIFWVAFYGLQGFWLLRHQTINVNALNLAAAFLLISFVAQYLSQTYGYLDLAGIDRTVVTTEYIILGLIVIGLNQWLRRR